MKFRGTMNIEWGIVIGNFVAIAAILGGFSKWIWTRLDKKFETIDKKFENMDKKLDNLEIKFDQKLEKLEKKIDEKLDSLEKKFEHKFDKIEEKISNIQVQIGKLEASSSEERVIRVIHTQLTGTENKPHE